MPSTCSSFMLALGSLTFVGHANENDAVERFLLVRPCARWPGDGLSGLSRFRVTGDCCGDGICSSRWETFNNCPQDCAQPSRDLDADRSTHTKDNYLRQESADSEAAEGKGLFGDLALSENDTGRDVYHCESMYDEEGHGVCSWEPQRQSAWLNSYLHMAREKELPVELPAVGAKALDLGAGLGQDSRNMAKEAGWSVTAVDVSASVISRARTETSKAMSGVGPGKVDYIAYDALALPKPHHQVDMIFDATVYCSLRKQYLARLYSLWRRLATPNHTLVLIQCWRLEHLHEQMLEEKMSIQSAAWRDMAADFEPVFDILHSEGCEKNQGGEAWCFFLKMKPIPLQQEILDERLALQDAARSSTHTTFLDTLAKQKNVSHLVYSSLLQIARANGRDGVVEHLKGASGELRDSKVKFSSMGFPREHWLSLLYGDDFEVLPEKRDAEDADGDTAAMPLVRQMRRAWELAEYECHGAAKKNKKGFVEVVFRNEYSRMPLHLHWRSNSGNEIGVLIIAPERERIFWAKPGSTWLFYDIRQQLIQKCEVGKSREDFAQVCGVHGTKYMKLAEPEE